MGAKLKPKHPAWRFTLFLLFVPLLVLLLISVPEAAPQFSEWSAPVNLSPVVNSPSIDLGPAISKNGLSLYFDSDRASGFGGRDLWVSQRSSVDAAWGPPQNLGPTINTPFNEAAPNLSRDGHFLFFNSTRPGGAGFVDIWVSERAHTDDDFGWGPPVNLGPGVNSAATDVGASYFENDDFGIPLLFFGSNRTGGVGNFDIYVSPLTADGGFGDAVLIPELSSPQSDQRPSIRFDGLEIFLHSDRPGSVGFDLWVSTRESTSDAWPAPVNLGPTVNGPANDQQAAIAADGQTLFFASDRPGGSGGLDLYVTTRTRVMGDSVF